MRRFLLLGLLAGLGVPVLSAQVTYERLRTAEREAQNWLTYSGRYAGWRHSSLDQINTANVHQLAAQWVHQTRLRGRFEATPLVFDGMIYFTGPEGNNVYALDARTGRPLWEYQRNLPPDLRLCCGRVNRGLAALGERLFLATLDAHLVALDAKSGQVVWDVKAADFRQGYSFTLAPLALKDKIVVGVAGGEFGIRGFVEAYDAETGKRTWRFNTVPAPGEPGIESWSGDSWKTGGAPAWVTGTYDPELNLTYWGIGNPGPPFYGEKRSGDNLYSNSVVALDAGSGKMKWFFQFTPHDTHDWDANHVPVLLDAVLDGQPKKLLVEANRNGFFYALDRTNGKFLFARPYGRVNWAKEIGRDGRPVPAPGFKPDAPDTVTCPGVGGVTNWMSPSYSPLTGLFYVACRELCTRIIGFPQPFREGRMYAGGTHVRLPGEDHWGAIRALDPKSGDTKWEFKYISPTWAGVLSTAGGLVFSGDEEGYLIALDARTGKELWHFQTGYTIASAPISYALEGRQYIMIPSGNSLFAFALPEQMSAKPRPAKR